jgi:acetyl-CoA acyltransferase
MRRRWSRAAEDAKITHLKPKARRNVRPMSKAVIAAYVRTPYHFAHKGALIEMRPDDLAAATLRAVIDRTGVDPNEIEDVIMGCAYPEGEQGMNVARIALMLAGLPQTIGGTTVNRFCGSSMTAIHMAAGQICLGAGEAFLCAGVESMTRVQRGGSNPSPNPRFKDLSIQAYISMGETAENVARQYNVSRADQEELAFLSQQKAAAAQEAGLLAGEIVPIETPAGLVERDGCLRPSTTLEGLAGLKPAFRENGTVTAGTSSPLTDGASATLVCSEGFARRNGLEPLARIRSVAVAGCAPEIMGMGPVPASQKALQRAGIKASDLDVVEINEAFGSQSVACLRELGIGYDVVNLDGGAIALGHPLGATGARITGKAAQLLKRTGGKYALSTQCVGGGQGVATVLEAM